MFHLESYITEILYFFLHKYPSLYFSIVLQPINTAMIILLFHTFSEHMNPLISVPYDLSFSHCKYMCIFRLSYPRLLQYLRQSRGNNFYQHFQPYNP